MAAKRCRTCVTTNGDILHRYVLSQVAWKVGRHSPAVTPVIRQSDMKRSMSFEGVALA